MPRPGLGDQWAMVSPAGDVEGRRENSISVTGLVGKKKLEDIEG